MMRSSKSGIVGVITGAISSARRRPFTQGLSAIHIIRGIQDEMREAGKVVPDDEQGQYVGLRALIDKGHRKIAFIPLHDELIASHLRKTGYHRAMREIEPSEPGLVQVGSLPGEGLRLDPLPEALKSAREYGATAIAFGNDLMALRARAQIAEMNWQVPQDVSLLGFDNDIAICEVTKPELSTVDLSYIEIGQQAAKRLVKIWESGESQGLEKVPCHYVERDSVRVY